MTVEIAILVLVLAAIASIFISTVITGASPLPTSGAVRDTMLAVLDVAEAAAEGAPDRLAGGPIFELGSGWGGLALALARRYPSSPVRAFEVSLLPWAFSYVRQLAGGPANLRFHLKNFSSADLGDAALVVCYLPGPAMEKLKPKLMAELPAGALVLSNTFALRGWDAIDVRTAPDAHASQVYLYRVGDTLK